MHDNNRLQQFVSGVSVVSARADSAKVVVSVGRAALCDSRACKLCFMVVELWP